MLSFAIKESALEFNWRVFSSCMILKLQGQIMVLSKCIFRRKFKCRQFWQQQFSTFSCNPKTSDSIYFKHRLEIGKNITLYFWSTVTAIILMLNWDLSSSRNFSLTFVFVYLQFSLQLCMSFWCDVCVCVFADIPWSMRACIAMCGAAWCQRKPSVELGWKGPGYEERNGIIQKHHSHLPPSKDRKEKNLFTGASTYGVPQKNLLLWKLAVANITADNDKSILNFCKYN